MPSYGGYTSSFVFVGAKGSPLCVAVVPWEGSGVRPLRSPWIYASAPSRPHESITSELLRLAQQLYNFLGRLIFDIVVVHEPVELLSSLLCDGCDSG